MKNVKRYFVFLIAAIVAFSAIPTAFAEDLPMVEKEDRFKVMESSANDEAGFSMISWDEELVIHINDEVPVFFEDGDLARDRLESEQTLSDLLNDRNLVVTYSITTRSLPPQTIPVKIVIMYEKIVPLPENIGQDISELDGKIIVNGNIIDAPAMYVSDGVVMVPIRAIAEALGFEVNWDDETEGVRLGVAINLWIGKDYYTVARMAPISLGAAPELTGDRTFVPISFFGEVITGYKAYLLDGHVVIEAAETGI